MWEQEGHPAYLPPSRDTVLEGIFHAVIALNPGLTDPRGRCRQGYIIDFV